MKSLMLLWQEFAAQCGEECSVSTLRDMKTVTDRVEHEGWSFFAITLPQFGKDFERSLELSCASRSSFQGFTWRGGLPAFLGGFLDLVFDRTTGRLVDIPSVAAIHSIRQLTQLFGKVEVPTTARRNRTAIEGYVDCETEVKRCDALRSPSSVKEFGVISHLLFGELFQRVDFDLLKEQRGPEGLHDPNWPYIHPKHGPGATADGLGGNAKFNVREWPASLENVFPYGEYAIPYWRSSDRYGPVDLREPGHERAAKLVCVPKTLKTPRLIAKEPTAKQYMQQAVKGLIVPSIQRDKSRMLGRMIGFDDQPNNHRLAHQGSLSGEYATLDLSEASDRVSNQLVRMLFRRWPHIAEAVDATRSRTVDVPGHGELTLSKFASMGSALTFPVEAMVFLAVVFIGIERELRRPLTASDVLALAGKVRVYGDDIIIPVQYAEIVSKTLEDFGLRVNMGKSFWIGRFRESCGKEYYGGDDVSIVRVRHVVVNPDKSWSLPAKRTHALEVESLVSLRNRCYVGGWWRVAKWLDGWIGPLLGGLYPTVLCTHLGPEKELGARSSGLVRWSVLGYQADYSLLDTQAPVVRCWERIHDTPESNLEGEGALWKCLSYTGIEPMALDHLEYAGRPTSSALKRRKSSPF